ncbi:MAG: transposase [Chloroflexi bacterium]|nr:transposase [Chloroflexota bacterium]
MLNPRHQSNRIGPSSQVLCAFQEILQRRVRLDLRETHITEQDLLFVLGYASVHRTSIETACQELAHAPSGNRLREVLREALPERVVLQSQLNRVLRAQLPPQLFKGKRSYAVALDITLLPYHGQPDAAGSEVLRAQAKSGTKHFHGYATVAIVHHRRRYVLALRMVRLHETMVGIVRDLLNRVRRLNIRIRRVYLDKEFYSVAIFKTLDRRRLAYVMPIPVRGRRKGVKALCHGRRSYLGSYTLHSVHQGHYTVKVAVVRRNRRPRLKRIVRWFVYAVAGLPTGTTPHHVFELYRQRFGIETSYRQMNQVRARTSSRDARLRLLLVGLALIVVNLYVTLRHCLRAAKTWRPASGVGWFSLCRLALFLARAFEKYFGVSPVLWRQPILVIS